LPQEGLALFFLLLALDVDRGGESVGLDAVGFDARETRAEAGGVGRQRGVARLALALRARVDGR
jgi:hypothetical protein